MVISLLNKKGGVGKTTVASNVAQVLGLIDKKVLCIDNDEQHNLSASLGIRKLPKTTLADVYEDIRNLPNAIVSTFIENVDCIAGGDKLSKVKIRKDSLKEIIQSEIIKEVGYDYVIIDNSPSTDNKTMAAIFASDVFIIPVQLKYFAIQGLNEIFMKLVSENVEKDRIQILRNEFRKFNSYQGASLAVENMFPENTLKTIIPYDEEIDKVVVDGKSMLMSKSKAKSVQPFIELVIELFGFDLDEVFNKLKNKRDTMKKEILEKYRFKSSRKSGEAVVNCEKEENIEKKETLEVVNG
jgi:chromosome partitioning protein